MNVSLWILVSMLCVHGVFCSDPEPTPKSMLTTTRKRTMPQRLSCRSCAVKYKTLTNTTSCTQPTFKAPNGIMCSAKEFCYTEIITPVSNPKTMTILKRGCTDYSINACVDAVKRDGKTFRKCTKSCNEDLCNVDSVIGFDKSLGITLRFPSALLLISVLLSLSRVW